MLKDTVYIFFLRVKILPQKKFFKYSSNDLSNKALLSLFNLLRLWQTTIVVVIQKTLNVVIYFFLKLLRQWNVIHAFTIFLVSADIHLTHLLYWKRTAENNFKPLGRKVWLEGTLCLKYCHRRTFQALMASIVVNNTTQETNRYENGKTTKIHPVF